MTLKAEVPSESATCVALCQSPQPVRLADDGGVMRSLEYRSTGKDTLEVTKY